MATTHFETDNNDSGQAEFLGRLALVLMVLAVLAAAIVIGRGMISSGTSGNALVDQAGSTNPAALPGPTPARPTVTNPKNSPAPPAAQMPVPGHQAPAAANNEQQPAAK